jgi:hypothetical protein
MRPADGEREPLARIVTGGARKVGGDDEAGHEVSAFLRQQRHPRSRRGRRAWAAPAINDRLSNAAPL